MKQNINAYNPVEFKKQFESTEIYRNVAKDFDNLWWDQKNKFFDSLTPRHAVSLQTRGFSMIPFYYLQRLLEKNPTSIYDLGCGANLFKKYIPNIIGVDKSVGADHESNHQLCYPDIEDRVNPEYIKTHQNYFESVFSINALHFRPLSELRLVYEEFISMVAPGGRGFLSVNIQRMIESEKNLLPKDNNINYDLYVRTQLADLPCEYLIFDVNLSIMDEWLDGNIRLVFEK
jgi:SAM-dependent methyltransferase